MIYEHIKSGDLYRFMFDAWDVEQQKAVSVYMSMGTGVIFTRDKVAFKTNFKYVDDTQSKVVPRPHPFIPDDKEEGGKATLTGRIAEEKGKDEQLDMPLENTNER